MTITQGTPHGLQTKLYYNSGTHAAPVWVEIARTKGEKLPRGKKEIAYEGRDSDFEKTKGGHMQLGLSFTYRHVRGAADTVRDALLGSLVNGTPIEIMSIDAAITEVGAVGFRQYVEIMKMDKTAETSGIVEYEVEAKHTEYYESAALVEPDDYEVSTAAATTTTAGA